MTTENSQTIEIKKTTESDLQILFVFQIDKQANYLAAFTPKDPTDKKAYLEKWSKFLKDKSINTQTIICNGNIVGSIGKFEIEDEAEITYWIGREFWGQGIATIALQKFLKLEKVRPINGRVAFDNFGSQKVLEKCGFKKVGVEKGFANARGKEIEEIIYLLR